MKRELRGVAIGILLTMLVTGALASGISEKIEAYYNIVSLKFNNSNIETNTILYEGITYIPVRTVAETFDKEIRWDHDNKTAIMQDEGFNEDATESSEKSIQAKERIELEYSNLNLSEMSYTNLPILKYEEWDTEFKNAVMIGVLSKLHRSYLEVGDLEPAVWVDFENNEVYAATIKADNSIFIVQTNWEVVDGRYEWSDFEVLE
jgi:hypothetical protein